MGIFKTEKEEEKPLVITGGESKLMRQLDIVLLTLSLEGSKGITLGSLQNVLTKETGKTYESATLEAILIKLIKENYAWKDSYSNYYISFEGLVLIEDGGSYRSKVRAERLLQHASEKQALDLAEIQKQQRNLSIILAIGTSMAAVYYLLEVLKIVW